MISLITVYDDRNVLDKYLIRSLKRQGNDCELIALDNTNGRFGSAAEALNFGGQKANGNLLMFVHQDVFLLGDAWFNRVDSLIKERPDLGVAGVAGMRYLKKKLFLKVGTIPPDSGIGSVYHGPERNPWSCNEAFTEPIEVQTIDELLLILPKHVFEYLPFDEETCNDWHLYGVDYALSVPKVGFKSYILPIPVWHLSKGTLNASYFHTLRKILIKHKDSKRIFTTCGFWYTSVIKNILELTLMCTKAEIGKWAGLNNHGLGPYLRLLKMFYVKTGCI